MFAGLPAHTAGAILVDVPWHFRSFTDAVSNRDPRRHYRTMTYAEICSLPVTDLAARDCHLFLWTTSPFLAKAFGVIEAWRFRYSSVAFTWAKLKKNCQELTSESDFHLGLGHTTRKSCEFCLLARRGNPRRINRDVHELIVAPRREQPQA